jgi:hypothetical protein
MESLTGKQFAMNVAKEITIHLIDKGITMGTNYPDGIGDYVVKLADTIFKAI